MVRIEQIPEGFKIREWITPDFETNAMLLAFNQLMGKT